MQKRERLAVLIIGAIIAISLFSMSLRGRYQYVDGISHDTWTGKVYMCGTKFIDKSQREIEAKRQKEEKRAKTKQQKMDDFEPIEDSFVPDSSK